MGFGEMCIGFLGLKAQNLGLIHGLESWIYDSGLGCFVCGAICL